MPTTTPPLSPTKSSDSFPLDPSNGDTASNTSSIPKYIYLNTLRALLLTLLAIALTLPCFSLEAQAQKPNVIFIFADDLGPGLLGCYGQKIIQTPNIDSLAKEGMKFTNYYGGTFCAPARWTLLTGLHDGRMGGWSHNRAGLLIQRDAGKITEAEYQKQFADLKAKAFPIQDNDILLGQVAQKAGYKTAQFGKLDRGFATWNERVQRHGWDYHFGYYDHVRAHGFYPPYLWENGKKVSLAGNTDPHCGKTSEKGLEPVGYGGKTYSQNIFIQKILEYIRTNKNHPFFLYHPTQLPHGPIAIPEIHPDYLDDERLTFQEKKYASMVKMLDDHVGLILNELKTLGIDDNTIFFFTSDNGHELYYGPKPTFRKQTYPDGKKTDLDQNKWRTSDCGDIFDGAGGRAGLKRAGYQGGIQCPMLVRWPGKIPAQTTTNILSTHYDFMATLADIVGTPRPSNKDSLSYYPTLLGQQQTSTHDYIIVHNKNKTMGSSAIIDTQGYKALQTGPNYKTYQLYNILTDNEERHNLAQQYPEKLKQLSQTLEKELNSPPPRP